MEFKNLKYFIFSLFNMKSYLVPKCFILFLPKVNLLYLPLVFYWTDLVWHSSFGIYKSSCWLKTCQGQFYIWSSCIIFGCSPNKKNHWISFFSSISFLSKGSDSSLYRSAVFNLHFLMTICIGREHQFLEVPFQNKKSILSASPVLFLSEQQKTYKNCWQLCFLFSIKYKSNTSMQESLCIIYICCNIPSVSTTPVSLTLCICRMRCNLIISSWLIASFLLLYTFSVLPK